MPFSAPARNRRPCEPALSGGGTARRPVEVRCGSDDAGAPAQFLWRSALWVVREAYPDLDPGPALGYWRVLAGQGPGRSQHFFRLSQDEAGGWWLGPVPA